MVFKGLKGHSAKEAVCLFDAGGFPRGNQPGRMAVIIVHAEKKPDFGTRAAFIRKSQ